MAGYTKQDTTGKIANGNIVDADDFNDEFNTLQTAFGSTGGHDHSDTSSGNGAPITKAGADHRYEFGNDALIPKNSFTSIDVGSSTRKFDNAHFNGKVNSATLETTGAATLNSLVVGSSTAVTSVDTDLSSVAGTDTTLASAKAIKTYVDAQITAEDLDITTDSGTIAIDLDSETLTIEGGTGVSTSAASNTVTITSDDANIDHDSLNNFVANEHINHTSVSVTAGNGLTGGGNISATRTLTVDPHTGIAVTADGVALSHLGLQDLTDPSADRVAFWDDSAGKFDWLTMGTNLSITGTTLNATDTDTNTTYSAGIGLTLDGTTFKANVEGTEQTVGAQAVTATASRSYAVQVDGSDNLIVNVPWVDTNTDTDTTYTAGTGLTLDGTTFNANVDATTQTVASETVSATANRSYAVQVDSSDNLVVNVPWSTPSTLTSSGAVYITPTTSEDSSINSPEVIIKSAATPSNDTRAPDLVLYNTDTVLGLPAVLGEFQFRADNASSNTTTFASIVGRAMGATNTDEDGEISIKIKSDGSDFTVFEAFSQSGNYNTTVASPGSLFFESGSSSPTYYFMPQFATNNNTNVDVIIRNRDTVPADGQVLGTLRFQGEDSASSILDYVSLEASTADESAATQDGTFKIKLYNGGFENTVFEGNSLGHTIVSAGNDIYLKATSDDVYLQGLNGTSAQIRFSLSGSAEQALRSSGNFKIITSDGTLNSTFIGANLTVAGALAKGSGSFKIDHPLPAKADTHHLVHSFIEGPQADLIYRGRVTLADSSATVDIDIAAGMTDGTFVALCEDVQCFTSNESGWAAVKGSVSGNTLTITAQDNACTDTISWMVVGERKDPHMLDAATDWTDSQGKVIVEPAKPAE